MMYFVTFIEEMFYQFEIRITKRKTRMSILNWTFFTFSLTVSIGLQKGNGNPGRKAISGLANPAGWGFSGPANPGGGRGRDNNFIGGGGEISFLEYLAIRSRHMHSKGAYFYIWRRKVSSESS